MSRGRFTEAEDVELRRLRLTGLTIEETAAAMERPIGSVSGRLSILGISGPDEESAQRAADARFQHALAQAALRGEFPTGAAA